MQFEFGFILVHIVHLKQPKGVQCTVQLEAVGRSLLESKVSMQSYIVVKTDTNTN